MPTYSYLNKKTGDVSDITMSISEMEKFESDNPHMQREYNTLNIVDPAGIGVSRPPADFQKYVLGKVKAASPGASAVGNKRWHIPKEI